MGYVDNLLLTLTFYPHINNILLTLIVDNFISLYKNVSNVDNLILTCIYLGFFVNKNVDNYFNKIYSFNFEKNVLQYN